MDGEFVEVEADEEQEALMAKFMNPDAGERRTLADMIMEKLAERDAAAEAAAMGGEDDGSVDPRVQRVYEEVGKFMASYRSGKLPKVLKMLPGLRNWEELLWYTRPDSWTAHAMFAATRVFASNLDALRAQRFFHGFLLPAVRDNIGSYKKLNYHLYMALRKACYKPAAFFKGIMLPLVTSGSCSLREATIIASVIKRMRLPSPHAAAAIMKLATMKYSGAQSVFLTTLINKKYALPHMVIDAVVSHFASFVSVPGTLPVAWHQSLLALCTRYKTALNKEHREIIKRVMKVHKHAAITAECRRELAAAAQAEVTAATAATHE